MIEDPADMRLLERIEQENEGLINGAYVQMGAQAPMRNGKPMLQQMEDLKQAPDPEDYVVWHEALTGLLDFLWAAGPYPEKALQRLIAFTWAIRRHHLADMTQTQLGELTRETRAAWCNRIKLIYSAYLQKQGYRGTRLPGQKSLGATQVYAEKAKGNTSRKAGKKKGDTVPKSNGKRIPNKK